MTVNFCRICNQFSISSTLFDLVTLSGNVFNTLADIEAIGDDFHWDESGGCGKGEQNGLPVGCGGPSLRIGNVVVGGDTSEVRKREIRSQK